MPQNSVLKLKKSSLWVEMGLKLKAKNPHCTNQTNLMGTKFYVQNCNSGGEEKSRNCYRTGKNERKFRVFLYRRNKRKRDSGKLHSVSVFQSNIDLKETELYRLLTDQIVCLIQSKIYVFFLLFCYFLVNFITNFKLNSFSFVGSIGKFCREL